MFPAARVTHTPDRGDEVITGAIGMCVCVRVRRVCVCVRACMTHSPGPLIITGVKGTVGTPQVCLRACPTSATNELQYWDDIMLWCLTVAMTTSKQIIA